ncbi:uncharacterized protein LOC143284224 isoform X2 [Babylonia areolata]|uniref:uncharacterized protein LOC143284224 isoform X2 n=1 Tax=Babylonia areolata TaxID=304850 RepID=UPI003FD39B96
MESIVQQSCLLLTIILHITSCTGEHSHPVVQTAASLSHDGITNSLVSVKSRIEATGSLLQKEFTSASDSSHTVKKPDKTEAVPGGTSPPPDITVTTPGGTSPPPDITVTTSGDTSQPSDITVTTPGGTSPPPDITVTTPGGTSPPPDITMTTPGDTSPPPDITVTTPGGTSPPPPDNDNAAARHPLVRAGVTRSLPHLENAAAASGSLQMTTKFQTRSSTTADPSSGSEKDVSMPVNTLLTTMAVYVKHVESVSESAQAATALNKHVSTTVQPPPVPETDVATFSIPFPTSVVPRTDRATNADSVRLATSRYRPQRSWPCDKYIYKCCSCFKNQAMCLGTGACRYRLPPLLPQIKDFRMTNASLPNLTRDMMAQLSNNKIRILNLASNNISRLESDTFADFPNLMFLDLSGNQIPVKHLQIGLKSINSLGLKTLVLERMGLTTLPDNFFKMFTSRSLDRISLAENHLTSFNSAVFAPFEKIRTVDLKRNQMLRVNISTRQIIKTLRLEENRFFYFPDLCLYVSPASVINAFPGLLHVRIGSNSFRRIPSDVLRGICLPQLNKLDISSSPNLNKLENNFISQLPGLEILTVNKMSRLADYEPFAFNSSSLKRLSLSGNNEMKSARVDVNHMFKHCPNLEILTISNTRLGISETQMWQLLVPLTSLSTLRLERVRGSFPEDLLWRMPKLKRLYLQSNGLSSSSLGRALRNVTSLRYLSVTDNAITLVNESTLPWPLRQNLTYLDLSHNPFSCVCDLRWFQRWLEDVTLNKSVKVQRYRFGAYRCQTPQKRKGVQVMDVRFTEEECGERSLALTLGVAGGCLLAALCLLAGLVYRYRWYLRFYLYRYRRRRLDGQGTEPIQFDFDVYLAYSSEDVRWVCQQLVPLLEEDHGLRTFFPDRDTVPGTIMAENITRSALVPAELSPPLNCRRRQFGGDSWTTAHESYC